MTFDEALKHLLKHEGGFSNHPRDPGGRTNLGVTQRVWEEWVGRESSEKEMRELTPEKVAPLYRKKYWEAAACDRLPSGINYAVFDFAVNSGVGRAVKTLQQVVGVTADGAIGPKTLAAVASTPDVVEKYQAARLAFLQGLSTFDTFGKGWSRRVAEVGQTASALA